MVAVFDRITHQIQQDLPKSGFICDDNLVAIVSLDRNCDAFAEAIALTPSDTSEIASAQLIGSGSSTILPASTLDKSKTSIPASPALSPLAGMHLASAQMIQGRLLLQAASPITAVLATITP